MKREIYEALFDKYGWPLEVVIRMTTGQQLALLQPRTKTSIRRTRTFENDRELKKWRKASR